MRIANVGVMDVLDYENERPLQALQQEDLRGLGLLIVQLARRQEMPPSDSASTAALHSTP